MTETRNSFLVETLLEALETMAFVTLLPSENPQTPPPSLQLVVIGFTRPEPGELRLVAPLALGRLLCANILGVEPDDAEAEAGAADALRELANVTCGMLLRKRAATSTEPFQMGIPKIGPFDPQEWPSLVAGESDILDGDGHTLAIAVSGLE